MEIRVANSADKADIISLYERSQIFTGLPNPALIPAYEIGPSLYERHAIERYVAVEAGRIVGHAMIEEPNPDHELAWRYTLQNANGPIAEMGAAFVEPALLRQGIWTGLLLYRIRTIGAASANPMTATWSTNEQVKRTFRAYGAIDAGRQTTPLGDVDLFVFRL